MNETGISLLSLDFLSSSLFSITQGAKRLKMYKRRPEIYLGLL